MYLHFTISNKCSCIEHNSTLNRLTLIANFSLFFKCYFIKYNIYFHILN